MLSRRLGGPFEPPAVLVFLGLLAPRRRRAGRRLRQVTLHKYEYRIPMRDGVQLFTSVYVPKDQGRKYPIMLQRTPYSVAPYGEDAYQARARPLVGVRARKATSWPTRTSAGDDVRGRIRQHAAAPRPQREKPTDIDESTDTYDTIDWLIKNVPGNNGRVGMWGISYPGFYAAAGMIDAHPALKAASPQAPVTDWFTGDDWHHNGAFFLPHAFNFLASGSAARAPSPTSRPGPTVPLRDPRRLRVLPTNWAPSPTPTSSTSRTTCRSGTRSCSTAPTTSSGRRATSGAHLKGIKPAVMTVGGWYDAENLFGALETYKKVEASSPGRRTSW